MKLIETARIASQLLGFLITVVLITPPSALGAAVFYLDPDVSGGTHVGTQANPFNTLGAAKWAIVNNALASDNVTVYCSARNATTDTNQVWDNVVEITQKTPNPGHTLTFDGRSHWNSDDTTPSWHAYPSTGKSKCQNRGFNAQSMAHTKYNDVTIDGFAIVKGGVTAGYGGVPAICGDNWTIQNSDISADASTNNGPGILLVPTSDAAHEGTDAWCFPSSNIVIQDNTLHDSFGEMIYLGGAGCSATASAADQAALWFDNGACQSNGPGGVTNALPAHQNITIQRNKIYNCGSRGGQGDCTDVKGGIYNLTYSQNDVTGNSGGATGARCIIAAGTTTDATQNRNQNWVFERNKIHDCIGAEDGLMAIAQSWGTPNGVTLRNNIIANVTLKPCLRLYSTQALGIFLYNNTIYGCAGEAVNADPDAVITMTNDALLNNNAGGNQVTGGTVTASFNAFSGTFGTTCTSCVSGLTSAAFTNVTTENFTLPSNSILIGKAVTIPAFSNDYLNNPRPPGSWDIGAYQFRPGTRPPSPPLNLRVN